MDHAKASNRYKHDRKFYLRAREASDHFQISTSTLWHWVKNRPDFPQPLKAGARVTLFDIEEIEQYLLAQNG